MSTTQILNRTNRGAAGPGKAVAAQPAQLSLGAPVPQNVPIPSGPHATSSAQTDSFPAIEHSRRVQRRSRRQAVVARRMPVPRGSRDDIRMRLGLRLDRFERRYPAALELYADALEALHAELHGCASQLCGPYYTDRNWRDVLIGERDLGVKDLCRLAVSPHPRAGAAVDHALARLAAVRGWRLQKVGTVDVAPLEASARVIETVGELEAALQRAIQNDGRIDMEEAAGLEPKAQRAVASLTTVQILVAKVREVQA